MIPPMSEIVVRDATRADLAAIKKLLEASNQSGIEPITAVAEEKCFRPDASSDALTRLLYVDDSLEGLSTVSGRTLRMLAVHPRSREQGLGSRLLDDAERIIRAGRHPKVVVAAAAGNYLTPGVNRLDATTVTFLERRGYRSAGEDTVDMKVALSTPTPPPPLHPVPIRRCEHSDRERLYRFIADNFARAWAWEVDLAFSAGKPTCLVAERKREIVGFSGWELNNRGLGSFGPQGVVEHERGSGIGKRLLLDTLSEMSRAGHRMARIPWVSSVDYYRKSCGARVAAQYAQLSKSTEVAD